MREFKVNFLLSSSYMIEAKEENEVRQITEDILSEKKIQLAHFFNQNLKKNVNFTHYEVTDVLETGEEWEKNGVLIKDYDAHFVIKGDAVILAYSEEDAEDKFNDLINSNLVALEMHILHCGIEDIEGYVKEVTEV